jgi:hypothetical protein
VRPGVDLADASQELVADDPDGVGPEQETERRLQAVDRADDGLRCAVGFALLGAVGAVVLLAAIAGGVA